MPLSKNKILLMERLKTRKGRAREGQVLVEGIRCVQEALAAGVDVRFMVRSERLAGTEAGRELWDLMVARDLPVEVVDESELVGLADTENPQGVLLVCAEPQRELSVRPIPSKGPILILDAIQDPGNLGTLVRAGRAFGASAIVALDGSVDPWNAKAVRASAGACFHLDVVRAKWADLSGWLSANNVRVLAADPEGSDVATVETTAPWALVVGNEGAGLRPEVLAAADARVGIPMGGGADSLNAGVAGSILLYVLTTNGSDVP